MMFYVILLQFLATSRPHFYSFGRMSLGRQASPAPEPAAKASAKHLGLKTTLGFPTHLDDMKHVVLRKIEKKNEIMDRS